MQCTHTEMSKPTSSTVVFEKQHKTGGERSGLLWEWDNKLEACIHMPVKRCKLKSLPPCNWTKFCTMCEVSYRILEELDVIYSKLFSCFFFNNSKIKFISRENLLLYTKYQLNPKLIAEDSLELTEPLMNCCDIPYTHSSHLSLCLKR